MRDIRESFGCEYSKALEERLEAEESLKRYYRVQEMYRLIRVNKNEPRRLFQVDFTNRELVGIFELDENK